MRTLGYIICDVIYAPFSNTYAILHLVIFGSPQALFSLFVFEL